MIYLCVNMQGDLELWCRHYPDYWSIIADDYAVETKGFTYSVGNEHGFDINDPECWGREIIEEWEK